MWRHYHVRRYRLIIYRIFERKESIMKKRIDLSYLKNVSLTVFFVTLLIALIIICFPARTAKAEETDREATAIITLEPDDVYAEVGETVVFAVESGYKNAVYQWEVSTDKKNWKNSGASGSKLSKLSIAAKKTRTLVYYRCAVTVGKKTEYSRAAALNIKTYIDKNPIDATGIYGDYVRFSVNAYGTDLKYSWQYSKDGKEWKQSKTSSASKSTVIVPVTKNNNGFIYRCMITGGGKTVYSNSAELTSISMIEKQPRNAVVDYGDRAKFSVKCRAKDATYQWQYSKDGKTWTNCTSAGYNRATYSAKAGTTSDVLRYRCVITNGKVKEVSAARKMTIKLKLLKNPKDKKAFYGDKITAEVLAAGTGRTYRWQKSDDWGRTWIDCDEKGCNTSKITISNENDFYLRYYRCIVKTDENEIRSEYAEIQYDHMIVEEPCSYYSDLKKKAVFSVVACGQNVKYQWQYSNDRGENWKDSSLSGAKTSTISVEVNEKNAKKLFRCVVKNNSYECTTTGVRVVIAGESDIRKYSYEIIPLLPPFNEYFYIKTDNPDPDSFLFIDKKTKYCKNGYGVISVYKEKLADVIYEDEKTYRVNGGYIGYSGGGIDGGEMVLQKYSGHIGNWWYRISGYENTDVKVKVNEVKDKVAYLIDEYGDATLPLLDNLYGIEQELQKISLYSGSYIKSDPYRDTNKPYSGITTFTHKDQSLYICTPFYRRNEYLLASRLYPFILDSLSFPGLLGEVAERLDENAIIRSTDTHYLITVSDGDNVLAFGGAGFGAGKGISKSQLKYLFSFDNSESDAIKNISMGKLVAIQEEYREYEEIDDIPEEDKLTWDDVRRRIDNGSYIKTESGRKGDVYTYIYNKKSDTNEDIGFSGIGCFSNAWYDGRYYDDYESFVQGKIFDNGDDEDKANHAKIIIKNMIYKLPDDGRIFHCSLGKLNNKAFYNSETGVWYGYMTYKYDESSDTWISVLKDYLYYQDGQGGWNNMTDEDFIRACTLTRDDLAKIQVDKNTNKLPEAYYIYDMKVEPGTVNAGISVQPCNCLVKTGNYATFSVLCAGDNVKYQWQYSTDGKNWSSCSEASSKTYELEVAVNGNNKKLYRCKVSIDGKTYISDSVGMIY